MRHEVPSKALEWTSLILGAGLACTGLVAASLACVGIVCDDTSAATWNAGLVGTLIACCSAALLYRYETWAEWSNLAFGSWTMVAPFLLGFGAESPMWIHVVVGICVTTIAAWQLLAGSKAWTGSRTRSAAHR
ncbi:SPW repeat protein [Taklimakanibacter deserti]|uniref:SPW repeat protein n=1 Tax=Taklimakanibacter deserti TaxID=2267839 RepID=UPI000E657C36